jgi:hypothetical protein
VSICDLRIEQQIRGSDQTASVVLEQITQPAKREKITQSGAARIARTSLPKKRFTVTARRVDETEHDRHLQNPPRGVWITHETSPCRELGGRSSFRLGSC